MRSLVALLVLAAPVGALGQAGVLRGPYVGKVGQTSATVLWETPTPSTGVVRWGQNAAGAFSPRTHHEIRLEGLTPDTEIEFVLEVVGEERAGTFVTAPAAPRAFSFLVYGDNRSSPTQHQAVVDAMLSESSAHFMVNTGDLVNRGDRESEWDTFFEIERPLLARLPLYVAIGNHEVDGGQWDVAERLFAPPRDQPPSSPSDAYYAFTWGNAQLIFINHEVNTLRVDPADYGAQETWLASCLDNPPPGVEHRFLFIHKGPYSSKAGRSGNGELRGWLDRLKAAGVDAIFSGHDHYAERGFAKNGLPYFIHGGGGAPLYDHLGMRLTPDHTIMWGETRLGYAVVEVDGPRASITMKGLDGAVVSSFTYGDVANPECVEASDCGAPPAFACAEGSWECARASCRWRCPPDAPPAADAPAPECVAAADCAGRPPPVAGCEGSWACADEVCEFTPAALCEAAPPPPVVVPGVRAEPGPLPAGRPDDALPAGACAQGAGALALPWILAILGLRPRRRVGIT